MFETGIETLKLGLVVPKKPSDLPYKEAVLVNRANNLAKRWYIEFSALDTSTGKLRRKQVWIPAQFKTAIQRKKYAEEKIKAINRLLAKGACFNKVEKEPEPEQIRTYTLPEALVYAVDIKNSAGRRDSKKSYRSTLKHWLDYSNLSGLKTTKVTDISQKHIYTFLDYLIKDLGNGPTTRNNYLGFSKSLFNVLVERGIIESNPCKGIKELREEIGKHTAFTDDQIASLKSEVQKDKPLYIAVLLLYYCFIRPKEIRMLRRKHVDLAAGKITVPASISKNGKTESVNIPGPLRTELEKLGYGEIPGEWFITGTEKMLYINQLGNSFRAITRSLKLGPEYTLYSWKHTGVVKAYRAGIDIKAIQAQCRHSGIEITDKYLRSLGLFENREIQDNFPAI